METKKLIKNELGKSHICESLSFFPKPSLSKNEDKFMSHLRFKNLFKVSMITHATIP